MKRIFVMPMVAPAISTAKTSVSEPTSMGLRKTIDVAVSRSVAIAIAT